MRLVQLTVSDEQREDVLTMLREENVTFVLTRDTADEATLVQFPLPTEAVETVLDKLREVGLSEASYLVVTQAELATTSTFESLTERFVEGAEEDEGISAAEIRAKAREMNPGPTTYYAMTLLSVIVATVGLLLDAPAIVVGSMVIGPQVTTALAVSVGLPLGDERMVSNGIRAQLLGFIVAILGAALFGFALRTAQFVPSTLAVETVGQISNRTSPGLLTLLVGVCAGAAGALGLSTELPVSLVGVAVAAALVPAAAAVGIGIAWSLPAVALGAMLLLAVNAVTINATGAGVLWFLGYRPSWWSETSIRGALVRTFDSPVAVGQLLLVVGLLVVSGGLITDQSGFENATNGAVQDVLDRSKYESLELLSVTSGVTIVGGDGETKPVTVVVSRNADSQFPTLSADIAAAVSEQTGERVRVTVEFTERQRATARAGQT